MTKRKMVSALEKLAELSVTAGELRVTFSSSTASPYPSSFVPAGNPSIVSKINGSPMVYRAPTVSIGSLSEPQNKTVDLIFHSNERLVNLTVRPQIAERELKTERFNKSLELGYMPPKRLTTAEHS